jgi:phosphoglycerate kinase
MPKLRTMDDIPLDGKRVIVRTDFNVSVGEDGQISEHEDYRIEAALPTIQELQQRRCKVLVLAHRGRPHEAKSLVSSQKLGLFDMKPIQHRLEDLLKEEVRAIPKLYGQSVEAIAASMEPGSVAIYPNIRLDDREITNSEKFGREIAGTADVYVNEAFSVSHRAHTSMTVLPRLMLSCAGRRTAIEIEELKKLQGEPERPYVAIVSGAKVVDKVGMLRRLLQKIDTLCVGGQIANVFIAASGKWPVEKC